MNIDIFDYVLERSLLLVEAEYIYHPSFLKRDLILTDKAKKDLKKNPVLKQGYYKVRKNETEPTFGWKKLERPCSKGSYSFDLGKSISFDIRGIGERDPVTKQFIVDWIGTHEDYNNLVMK